MRISRLIVDLRSLFGKRGREIGTRMCFTKVTVGEQLLNMVLGRGI